MRIAFLLPDFRGGGAQHMVINMANEFAARGHAVTLLVIENAGPYAEKISSAVRTVSFNCTRTRDGLRPLIDYLRNERPDILYAAMSYVNIIAVLGKILSGASKTAVIISERNFFSLNARQDGSAPSLIQKLAVGMLYPLADKIIGISRGVAEDLRGYLYCGREKLSYIHNPVVTQDTQNQLSQECDDPWFASCVRPAIVTSGRLVAQKDQKTLLRAFAKLRKMRPASLLILGEGPLRDDLVLTAQELGIEADVYFKGFVPNPLAYMKKADVFALSSAWEGFGNVVVEALLCGLPVVSTDCPAGPAEILDNGRYGFLVPVGDDDRLAQAMNKAISASPDPQTQKKRAMDFSVQTICDQYDRLFKEIVAQ